jgi:hypothetical protein
MHKFMENAIMLMGMDIIMLVSSCYYRFTSNKIQTKQMISFFNKCFFDSYRVNVQCLQILYVMQSHTTYEFFVLFFFQALFMDM